jgi:hypothetical protein
MLETGGILPNIRCRRVKKPFHSKRQILDKPILRTKMVLESFSGGKVDNRFVSCYTAIQYGVLVFPLTHLHRLNKVLQRIKEDEMKLKELLSLLILFPFIVTSCGNPELPTLDSNPTVKIEFQQMRSETTDVGTETVSQPNCTGVADVENVVEKSRTIEYVMEVQNGASVNTNGQVGFAGTDVELGATIAAQFGQSYGTSQMISRSLIVKAQPGTNMQHIIRHMEVWEIGQAVITIGGQQTIIPFRYRSDFKIELGGSTQLPCPTETSNSPSDKQPVAPTPENTPETTNASLRAGMDVQLYADKTDGKSPLKVDLDARSSFFIDANGTSYNCGVCNYTWYVYQGSNLLNKPERSTNGLFSFRFGNAGDYRVVVTVCRGQGEADCASDAEVITVK